MSSFIPKNPEKSTKTPAETQRSKDLTAFLKPPQDRGQEPSQTSVERTDQKEKDLEEWEIISSGSSSEHVSDAFEKQSDRTENIPDMLQHFEKQVGGIKEQIEWRQKENTLLTLLSNPNLSRKQRKEIEKLAKNIHSLIKGMETLQQEPKDWLP